MRVQIFFLGLQDRGENTSKVSEPKYRFFRRLVNMSGNKVGPVLLVLLDI